jgi:hypothetical protein
MKLFPLLTGLAFFASVQLLDQFSLRADPDPPDVPALPPTSPDAAPLPPTIIMIGFTSDDEEGEEAITEKTEGGKGEKLIGLQPDQVVDVSVTYGLNKAGLPVAATALSGGEIIAPEGGLIVDVAGMLTFQFQVGHEPGFYQVALRDGNVGKDASRGGGSEMGVHFWVLDTQAPDDNPLVTLPGDEEEGE